MPYRWIEGDLPRLAAHGLQLNLALPEGRLADPDLERLLRAAEAQSVPVGAWLLLPDAEGYWPNAENAAHFLRHVERFLDWLSTRRLRVAELIVDMETPLALSRLLKGKLLQGLQVEYRRWQNPLNAERFATATELFTRLVSTAHQAGSTVQVVTYPFLLHDAAAGNTAFQEFLQVPVTPVPWDRVSFMVYRSSFQDVVPMRLSSWLVYSFLELAQRVLTIPVSAALGVIGSIGKIQEGGFRDPAEIRADVAAAYAAGIDSIQLFSLDGMHQLTNPNDWLRLYGTAAHKPEPLPGDLVLWRTLRQSHAVLSSLARAEGKERKVQADAAGIG